MSTDGLAFGGGIHMSVLLIEFVSKVGFDRSHLEVNLVHE